MKKSEIIKIIDSLPEGVSLDYVSKLLKSIDGDLPPRPFTDSQKRMLKEAQEDIKAGRVISSEDLDKREDEWMNEK